MAKTQQYKLSADGTKTTVTDTTVWGGAEGARSSYAIIFGLLKFTTSGYSPCSLSGSLPVNLLDTNPAFVFDNKQDGYYVIRSIYAPLNTAPSVEGSVYYNTSTSLIYLYTSGAWNIVSYNTLVSHSGDIVGEAKSDIGLSPVLEKSIDDIWYEYFKSRQIHDGKDYKNFSLLYALLVGARASFSEGAYTEFDNKIENANKIAQRKIKEIR